MIKRLLSLILAITFAQISFGQAYNSGEKLTIEVEYWATLWPNTTVGEVVCQAKMDGDLMRISATATLSGLFGWMYKLNDTYTTWITPATNMSVRASSSLSEGSWRFASRYDFRPAQNRVVVESRQGDATQFTSNTVAAPSNIMDGVELFYWLRNQPKGFITAGQSKILPVMLEDAVRHIRITYHGTERKRIDGAMTNTLKYSCQVYTKGSQSQLMGEPFYVWLSDDKNHLPLLMESPIRVGNVRATLISAENIN